MSRAPRFLSSPAVLWAAVGILTLGGGVFRLAFNDATVWDTPLRADARQYAIYGYNLSHHGVFSQTPPSGRPGEVIPVPDSFRSPGYPLFLAGVFLLGDDQGFYQRALAAQAVVGSLLTPLTFLLGVAFLPAWAAVAAAGMVAFNPHLVSIGGNLLTETLFAFVLLASIIVFQRAAGTRSVIAFLWAGGLFGITYLVNEIALPIPLLLCALMLWWWKRTGRTAVLRAALRPLAFFLAAFLLFWGGWALRNHFSLPPGVGTGAGRALHTLSHGTYIDFIYKNPAFREFPYRDDPEQPAFGESWDNFIRIFGRRFAERPVRYISWYLLEKPYWLWSWDMLQGQGDVYVYPAVRSLFHVSPTADAIRRVYRFLNIPILAVVLCGLGWFCWRFSRRDPGIQPETSPLFVFAVLLYATIAYSIFACWSRYSLPFRPELYLALAWIIVSAARAPMGKGTRAEKGKP